MAFQYFGSKRQIRYRPIIGVVVRGKTGTDVSGFRRAETVQHVYDLLIRFTKNGSKAAVFAFKSALGNGSILDDFVLPLLMSAIT